MKESRKAHRYRECARGGRRVRAATRGLRRSIAGFAVAVAGLLCGPVCAHAAPTVCAIRPAPSTNVLINPGKGWILYGKSPAAFAGLLSMCGAGYARYSWSEIEPAEGEFRWAPIDDAIAAWSKAGRQFAFGVMCASTHSAKDRPFVTPEWVFKAGAKFHEIDLSPQEPTTGTPGRKVAPVFDDPVFLAKLRAFMGALGKRYDGNQGIAFIDIRSYGNWGEGHMHPFKAPDIAPAKLEEHYTIHLDAFRYTRLMLPWGSRKFDPIYNRMVKQGMGLRRDGICGNSDGSETARCLGIAPAVFEFYGAYQWMKEKGWWDGRKDATGRGFSLATCVTNGSPSYIGPLNQGGKGGTLMLDAERPLVENLANRMGYHFALKEARFPASLRLGSVAPADLSWENRGVAPICIPAAAAFALIGADGRILETCPASASKPPEWKPGAAAAVRDSICFRRSPPGDHRLAIGILRPGDGERPSIRIGIDTTLVDGWHVLGPVSLR